MKNFILFSTLVSVLTFANVSAQTKKEAVIGKYKLGLGADFGLPIAKFNKEFNYGIGGSFLFQYVVNNKLNLIANTGYINFMSKDLGSGAVARGFASLRLGGRYYVIKNVYAQAEIGSMISTDDPSGVSLVSAPSIGFTYPVSNKLGLDLAARYEGWTGTSTTTSFVALRLALNFGF